LTVNSNTVWIEIPLSLLSAVVVLVLANDILLDDSISIISRADGIILLFFFIIFMVYNFRLMKSGADESLVTIKDMAAGKAALFVAVGMVGLILGGRFIVTSATELALSMGISERIIGLTVVSIG